MYRPAQNPLRLLPLGSLAIALAATPALAQNVMQSGTELDLSSFQQRYDRDSMSGRGSGTWIEAGAVDGAAFAELYDRDGTPRFLVDARTFAVARGSGEAGPHGVIDGDLLPYELYLVPTDVQPVGHLMGQWSQVDANRGALQAVVVDTDSGAVLGWLQGTFVLPPIVVDPDLPVPESAVDATVCCALGRTSAPIGPFPVGASPDGGVGVLAKGLGSGQMVNPDRHAIPPFPAAPGVAAEPLGGGAELAAEGLQAASAQTGGSAQAGQDLGSLHGSLAHPDIIPIPPYPAGPSVQSAALGAGTLSPGMEPIQDASASSAAGGGGPAAPRVGELSLQWIVLR